MSSDLKDKLREFAKSERDLIQELANRVAVLERQLESHVNDHNHNSRMNLQKRA